MVLFWTERLGGITMFRIGICEDDRYFSSQLEERRLQRESMMSPIENLF